MRKLLFSLAIALLCGKVNAQQYSLQDCMDMAIAQNLKIKQQKTRSQMGDLAIKEAKDNRRPNIQGSLSQGGNFGRSLDPYSNSYVNNSLSFTNAAINGSYTLYDGGRNKLLVQEKVLLAESERLGITSEVEKLKLQVVFTYTQVLATQELVKQSRFQAEVTQDQIKNTQKLITSGIQAGVSLIDLKAQLANDNYRIVESQGQLSDAKIQLAQLIFIPYNEAFSVIPIDMFQSSIPDTETVYDYASKNRADIKAAQVRINALNYTIKQAKKELLPVISLNLGMGSNYSSLAKTLKFGDEIIQNNTGAYVIHQDGLLPVYTAGYSSETVNIGFMKQLIQNINGGISLQLRVPIGMKYQVKNKVLSASLQKSLLSYQQKEQEQTLRQEIERAINLTEIEKQKYDAMNDNVIALQEAFDSARKKLNAGTINTIEYTQTKSNLDRASLQLIQAKYEWLMRKKVIDFYMEMQY